MRMHICFSNKRYAKHVSNEILSPYTLFELMKKMNVT